MSFVVGYCLSSVGVIIWVASLLFTLTLLSVEEPLEISIGYGMTRTIWEIT